MMRKGEIISLCERRVNEDAGRYRLTFFHNDERARSQARDPYLGAVQCKTQRQVASRRSRAIQASAASSTRGSSIPVENMFACVFESTLVHGDLPPRCGSVKLRLPPLSGAPVFSRELSDGSGGGEPGPPGLERKRADFPHGHVLEDGKVREHLSLTCSGEMTLPLS